MRSAAQIRSLAGTSRNSTTRPPAGRKLAIICSKGTLDMAYPGLVLANATLGEGIETHLFFTFWGFDMINKKTMDDLKFTVLGNPATHMPQGLGGLPGMTAMATAKMKKSIADVGVPEVPEFLEQIVASGGHLWAGRMSIAMFLRVEMGRPVYTRAGITEPWTAGNRRRSERCGRRQRFRARTSASRAGRSAPSTGRSTRSAISTSARGSITARSAVMSAAV